MLKEVTEHVDAITSAWPASDAYLEKVQRETEKDPSLQIALEYTQTGWPEYKDDVKLGARHLYPISAVVQKGGGVAPAWKFTDKYTTAERWTFKHSFLNQNKHTLTNKSHKKHQQNLSSPL
ncbi:hypothetical protein ACOMHN_046823 [Nucella lapillus]